MIDKIKELRTMVPIPMSEAIQLLKDNDGDIEKSVSMFKASSIEQICEMTGCSEETAYEYYEAEKYDFNRTVSSVREAIYDANYVPIKGVDKGGLDTILQWIRIIEAEDFGVSLDYISLTKALETMLLVPSFTDTASMVRKAKDAKDIIFEGYKNTDSLDEFVRRHRQLDDCEDFQRADKAISLRITILKEELFRHLRNMSSF